MNAECSDPNEQASLSEPTRIQDMLGLVPTACLLGNTGLARQILDALGVVKAGLIPS